ncbi:MULTISPECIES: NAD(P)/FAD-dependent oxidoreductase [unclassified Minwuia]|jgi:cyclohexanone monooxygenase|uniref:flavin-containing monooxygenase n=1 Tax=unclassified Minwuia TaxID=2618799 RepID=UPI002479646E|nr:MULTISPECIES: NAD(P)/FAD-dependent oxidoreductase [unclassified Minwuia]
MTQTEAASDHTPAASQPATDMDVIVVGAGFAGMYLLHRLRGLGFRVQVMEAGSDVGGTWYWNRYPGARCDVESMQYSYQFDDDLQQEWEWSERYATQPEIIRYARHVADRFDLRRDIRFDCRVAAAHLDETQDVWRVTTEGGDTLTTRWFVMATGCLSSANMPDIPGVESFRGAIFHTGQWPHEDVDFTGKRVAVIGTGSSAIQSIPIIAEQAASLTVFQRTANYAIPARNRPLDPEDVARIKAHYGEMRAQAKKMPAGILFQANDVSARAVDDAERQARFEHRWQKGGLTFLGAFNDLLLDEKSNRYAADFVRNKIRKTVKDPKVAELLCPTNIIGCKRLCVDSGYYETFNRQNVHLVDISGSPIEALTESGLRTGGEEYAFDCIVFATGFDAMTGSLLRVDIRGSEGRPLAEKWQEGPKTYLGLMTAGFPNMFMVTGPGSPSVLTNMLPSVEQHAEFIADCIAHIAGNGLKRIEAEPEAEEAWVAHGDQVAGLTLRSTCSSWYVGANIPGKPRVFMPYIGGFPAYLDKCAEVVANGYEGFRLS